MNKLNSGNLIYFYYKFFYRAKKVNTYATKSRILRSQMLSFLYLYQLVRKLIL